MKKSLNTVLGDIFFSYFPEGKLKNRIKCFIANKYLFRNLDFTTTYKNDVFYVNYHQNVYEFCDYPSSDFYEILEGYLRKATIKKGDTVIDCGAYQGSFTVLASKLAGKDGTIVAFEPDPENYKKLLHNLKLNKVSNVITINKGLWNSTTELYFKKDSKGSSFLINPNDELGESLIKVPVVGLDEELFNLGVQKVNFIKADVEGSEIELVKGSKKTLLNNHVSLAIASYHQINGENTSKTLEEILKKMGYTTTTEFEDHLTTYAAKK
jgi:FkbM family methyltransferase